MEFFGNYCSGVLINAWMVVQEIDQLCEEWTPEPLHPTITDDMEMSTPVLERYMGRPDNFAHENLLYGCIIS